MSVIEEALREAGLDGIHAKVQEGRRLDFDGGTFRERRAVTPAMALRLARLFGNTPEFPSIPVPKRPPPANRVWCPRNSAGAKVGSVMSEQSS
jgi:hypothetical protein